MSCYVNTNNEVILDIEERCMLAPSGVSQSSERVSVVGGRDPDHPSRALPTAFHPTRLLYSALVYA